MKKLITRKRWKNYLRNRQISELNRRTRVKPPYIAPKANRPFKRIRVPAEFSFIHNVEAMNDFLKQIRKCARTCHVSLDLTDFTLITPEAIAALTATISKSSLPHTSTRGNQPSDPEARRVLLESGFFDHVKSTVKLPNGHLGKIEERKSKLVESETAWELVECGAQQAFGAKKRSASTRAAFGTLVELMCNTHNHATGKAEGTKPWWATVYGDSTRRRVCYSFVDAGVGIFKSVQVRWVQRAFRKLRLGNNAKLLLDILEGRVESRTGLPYRGKGLPQIYKMSKNGKLMTLFIISNDVFADITKGEYRMLEVPFPGTLYYWECEE